MFWWKDKQIAEDIGAPEGAEVIEGKGKTLMPGLIDCHQHLNEGRLSLADQFADLYYVGIAHCKYATGTLTRRIVRVPESQSPAPWRGS